MRAFVTLPDDLTTQIRIRHSCTALPAVKWLHSSLHCWMPCRNTRKRKHETRRIHILDVWASYGKQHNDITYLWQSCTATVNNRTMQWPVWGPVQCHLCDYQWITLQGKTAIAACLIRRRAATATRLKLQHTSLTLPLNWFSEPRHLLVTEFSGVCIARDR